MQQACGPLIGSRRNRVIPNKNITASSAYGGRVENVRLDDDKLDQDIAWTPDSVGKTDHWLKVEFCGVKEVTCVKFKNDGGAPTVKQISLKFSVDGNTWFDSDPAVLQVGDSLDIVTIPFSPVKARFVKLVLLPANLRDFYVKMELLGRDAAAEEPSSAKSPVAEPSAPKAPPSAAAAAPPAAAGSASAVPASPAPPAASSAAAARLLDAGDEPVEARSPLMGFSSTPVLSLEEAGRKCSAFVTELSVMLVACQALVVERKSSGEILGGISDAAAATLTLYSAGWDVPSKSFYAIVNAALRAKDRCGVVPHYGILRLMCVGFESLNPRIGTLYRGVRGALAHLYPIGKSIVWWAFSSCTTSIDVLQDELFLGKVGERTLFIIENAVGFDITAFSFFQNESEVLMPAGAEVLVKSHLDAGNGLTMVTLQMVRTTNCIVDLNKHLPAAANTPNMHGELVKGLNDVFEKAKLSDEKRALVTHWCREQEAAELEEIKELFDELCAAVEMPALPKKRFSKALDEALSGT